MKTVLITGGTRNTGLAIARHFASKGYRVAVTSRDEESAKAAAASLREEFSVPAAGYRLSFESVEEISSVFDEMKKDLGELSVFVANSAHLGVGMGLLGTTEEEFDSVIDVNLKGTFFCCQMAAQWMKETGGGSLVTIGSVQGLGAVPGRAVYGMTKAALSNLVKYMAYELAPYGIRANNLVAGAIHSKRWDEISEEEAALRRSRYPAGRESTEAEIAAAVYFLASEDAATITGTDMIVDSGLTACLLPYENKGEKK